ncbi:MAG TPA: CBS domain-containing protein [Steroidobacteraceae bacterium]|nr:CBS domain-containing protein [Steroidobacteraceae bacterium]
MKVGDICTRNVVTVPELDDLTAAARLMRKKHIGYLVVVEPNATEGTVMPVGVITDRDIVVRVIARETDARSLRVGDVMTRQPVITREDYSVSVALHYMREIGVRRVPVVNQAGGLVGVLSLDDVLDALAEELMDVASSIRRELKVENAIGP